MANDANLDAFKGNQTEAVVDTTKKFRVGICFADNFVWRMKEYSSQKVVMENDKISSIESK